MRRTDRKYEKRFLHMETRTRSLAKAISWRIFATLTTILLVFAFTGNLAVSEGVGITELVSKIVIYYVHERVWNVLRFGKVQRAK
jgi:adenylylsulfate kinase